MNFAETEAIKELQDQGQAIWVAELTDNSLVYQDNDEPNNPTWWRLAHYLDTHRVWVQNIHLKFRSNWVRNIIPETKTPIATLFFTQKSSGFLGGPTTCSYVFGWAEASMSNRRLLQTIEYSIPSLLLIEKGTREVAFSDHRLIVRSIFCGKK